MNLNPKHSLRVGHASSTLDRISALPEGVLCHILSFLPTNYAVRTSILSTRWKNIWMCVPNLDFDCSYFTGSDKFMAFGDHVLIFGHPSDIKKFRLFSKGNTVDPSRINGWIDTAARRNVVELDLHDGDLFEGDNCYNHKLPKSLFMCKTLVVLKLRLQFTTNIPTSGCLPSLKFLHVIFSSYNVNVNDSLPKLISICPVLDDLTIDGLVWRYESLNLDIAAPVLKTLRIGLFTAFIHDGYNCSINCPKLENVEVAEEVWPNFRWMISKSTENLDSYRFSGLLEGLSNVTYLCLSAHSFKVCALSVFENLRLLKLVVHDCFCWELLEELLNRSPILESLVLERESTIGVFASISDNRALSALFRKCMQSLLEVAIKNREETNQTDSNSMQLARLLDLAVSFLPGLGVKEVDLLFTAIKPHLQDREGLIQKKAYKVLSIILRDYDGFISSKIEDLLKLMLKILPSCLFPARRHRLDCLYLLVVHVSKSGTEMKRHDHIISSFLTEIILGLKEANKKTRNKACEILVRIGHAYGDEDKGGKRENLYQIFNMVEVDLAYRTPYVISTAMKGLAKLANEFSDLASNFLPLTSFLLSQKNNREIIKASLCFLKVLVVKLQAEGLQLHLKNMVEALLKWQAKTHFKAKVKILLEMLVKKCGLDAVKAVMPQEHMKFLTNIWKECYGMEEYSEHDESFEKEGEEGSEHEGLEHEERSENEQCSENEQESKNEKKGSANEEEEEEVRSDIHQWNPPEFVPLCLLSHLKKVMLTGFTGRGNEMSVAKYLLQCSEVLNKMVICVGDLDLNQKAELYKELSMVPRGSRSCTVQFN